MRPNASRSRITYTPPDRPSRSNYVYMRMERPWSIQSLAESFALLCGLICIAMLIVVVGVILPASGMTLRAFYVPVLFFTVGPIIARRLNWPPVVLTLIACLYAFLVIEQVIEPVEQSSSPVLAILILVLVAPVIHQATQAIGALDRPYIPTTAILCFIAALISAVRTEDPRALPVFVVVPVTLFFIVAALIIRGRAARLASSIDTPSSAAFRLIELSHWFVETPSVGVSIFSFWRTAVILTTLWGGWHFLKLTWLSAELSVAVPQPPDTDSLPRLMFHLLMMLVPLVVSVGGMTSPTRYFLDLFFVVPLACSDWLVDSHPSPHAVGIRSAAAHDWFGLPIRPLIVTALLTFSILLVVLLRTPLYPEPSADSLRPELLRLLAIDVAQKGLGTVCVLGVSLLTFCAPWVTYFSSILLAEKDVR